MKTPGDHERQNEGDTGDLTADLNPAWDGLQGTGNVPEKIGQYVIRRVIASGGMGTVYEALQENPRRPAAVKVVKRSMASGDALRRFKREAQALARLRHPGIAQIYEAGTYVDAGVSLPFFALEYIPNASTIIEFARARRLDLRGKVELFLQVCPAVHYGHQRGIIHRDLKPGNILVDSEGRARIIDFGVARAIDSDLEGAADQTRVGQIIGTAPYMSPEQFDADPNDLDTRSDVYTLGVVLYELLAEKFPYNVAQTGVFETARIVREEQPIPLREIKPGIDSELELIVTKALAKDRESRYQSAYGLAQDLHHFLRGEAISAKPASFSYQLKIMARRNKAVVGLTSLAVALLVGGIITTTALYLDVKTERAKSEVAADQAIAANDFLTNALAAVVPYGFGDQKTIGDLCNRVSEDIDGTFPDNPVMEADIRNMIGLIFSKIDNRAEAEQQLKKAYVMRCDNLGPSHELSLQALYDLNFFYSAFGPPQKGVETSRTYFAEASKLQGTKGDLSIEGRDLLIEALQNDQQFREAEAVAKEQYEILTQRFGQESEEAIYALQWQASLMILNGNMAQARISAQEAYELATVQLGENHADMREVRSVFASTLIAAGELDQAKALYQHRAAPQSLGIDQEYQGTLGEIGEAVKMLVFFETWCPYSQKYIPKIEKISRQYQSAGLDVLAFTQVNRSSSDARVHQFILENELSFPVLKENGRARNYFEATGTPYTVILHEGEMVWEGMGSVNSSSRLFEGLVNSD